MIPTSAGESFGVGLVAGVAICLLLAVTVVVLLLLFFWRCVVSVTRCTACTVEVLISSFQYTHMYIHMNTASDCNDRSFYSVSAIVLKELIR